jgi:hypothetical protein
MVGSRNKALQRSSTSPPRRGYPPATLSARNADVSLRTGSNCGHGVGLMGCSSPFGARPPTSQSRHSRSQTTCLEDSTDYPLLPRIIPLRKGSGLKNVRLVYHAVEKRRGRNLLHLSSCRRTTRVRYRLTFFLALKTAPASDFRNPSVAKRDSSPRRGELENHCALGRNRTCDLLDRNQTLYPLSYERALYE